MKITDGQNKWINDQIGFGCPLPFKEAVEWASNSAWSRQHDTLTQVVGCLESDLQEGDSNGAASKKQARYFLSILKKISVV
jgi:hypothetical protein